MNRELSIGRTPENDILIPDASVSRQHASLIISGDSISIRDNGSSNGTFINGMQITGLAQLRKNDILKVGNSLVPWMNYVDMAGGSVKTEIGNHSNPKPVKSSEVLQDLPNSSGAQTCGILGLIFSLGLIGIILNIIALSIAGGAISKYRLNPDLYTERSFRKAKAGQTMGIIGLAVFGFVLIVVIAANS